MKIDKLYDFFSGPCIRQIVYDGAPKETIYLSFDDGPDESCTPKVLELLARENIKATFFLIGEKAKAQLGLTQRILSAGHSIGNHSIDHNTKNYFRDASSIRSWLKRSDDLFTKELGLNPVGFRSPAGVKTPALNNVLKGLHWPLVLWDVRFYDTLKGLCHKAVTKKLSSISDGSIILLHDTHQPLKQSEFLSSLEFLIVECKKKNFQFLPLNESMIINSYLHKYGPFN